LLAGARGMEAYLLFWVRNWQAGGSTLFNIRLVRP
jgi:hypothetical protein